MEPNSILEAFEELYGHYKTWIDVQGKSKYHKYQYVYRAQYEVAFRFFTLLTGISEHQTETQLKTRLENKEPTAADLAHDRHMNLEG